MRNSAGRRRSGISPRRWPGTRRRVHAPVGRTSSPARCAPRCGRRTGNRCAPRSRSCRRSSRPSPTGSTGARGHSAHWAAATTRVLLHRSIAGQAEHPRRPGRRGTGPCSRCAATRGCPDCRGDRRGVRRTAGNRARIGAAAASIYTPKTVREWNWALRGRGDRALLAAAEYARHNQMFDRAISAAERYSHRARLRAAIPRTVPGRSRTEDTRPGSRSGLGLWPDPPGIPLRHRRPLLGGGVRTDAADHAGDRALAGAQTRHEAPRLAASIKDRRHEHLARHQLPPAGAHESGRSRGARLRTPTTPDPDVPSSWRGARPLEEAIYAETVPIGETRDFAKKKVMSNAVYYAALFEGKPQSLKARLGLLGSRGYAATRRSRSDRVRPDANECPRRDPPGGSG
ncbi:MAG: hypothetical protein MZW92_49465 [Comamonadaceae bacterium]|nr:hypothetical protein [Comamonadaceae bacterium]